MQATAAAMGWQGEFALAIMTGHAFQALISDQDVAASLAAIRRSLQVGGRFAFETRNPVDRAWQRWAVGEPSYVTDAEGRALQVRTAVLEVAGEVVTIEESTCASDGQVLRTDVFSLRFLGVEALGRAGLSVEERWGGWGGQPFAHDSASIITTALAR